jgi:hypothetical protein
MSRLWGGSLRAAGKKEKGSRAEREFAQMLVNAGLDKHAKRMPLSGAVKGLDSDIWTKLPFMFEVKNQETWKPLEYYRQANDANPNRGHYRTVVIMTKNREDMYAFMRVDDFIELISYALKGGLE